MDRLQVAVLLVVVGYVVAPYSPDLTKEETIQRYKDAFNGCDNKLNYACRCSFASIESMTCDFKCISLDRKCDGIQDCPLRDDETDCHPPKCAKGLICCTDGTCANLCDGIPECPDEADEARCGTLVPTGCDGQMQCLDGACATICDDNVECTQDGDTSIDEMSCKFACPADSYICEDGSCSTVCDGVAECQLGIDETKCYLECDEGQFSCRVEPNHVCKDFCDTTDPCEGPNWYTEEPYCGACNDCDPFCQKNFGC